jgi:hypothetical protein
MFLFQRISLILCMLLFVTACHLEQYQVSHLQPISHAPFKLNLSLLSTPIPSFALNLTSTAPDIIEVDWENVQILYDGMQWSIPLDLYAPKTPIKIFYPMGKVEYHFSMKHLYLIEKKYEDLLRVFQKNQFLGKLKSIQDIKIMLPYRKYGTKEEWHHASWQFRISPMEIQNVNSPKWEDPFYKGEERTNLGAYLGFGLQSQSDGEFRDAFAFDLAFECLFHRYFGLGFSYKNVSSSRNNKIDQSSYTLNYDTDFKGIYYLSSFPIFPFLSFEPIIGLSWINRSYQDVSSAFDNNRGILYSLKSSISEEVAFRGAGRLKVAINPYLYAAFEAEYYKNIMTGDQEEKVTIERVNHQKVKDVAPISVTLPTYQNLLFSLKLGLFF